MKKLKLGLIGCGNMGMGHMSYLPEMKNVKMTAFADTDPERVKLAKAKATDATIHDNGLALIDEADVDAVLIATPHYDHPPLALAAFAKGLHVLCEKPVAVTAKAAAEVNDAYLSKYQKQGLLYGAMFQQRTKGQWKKIKQMMDSGTLGELVRVNWIITDWFRTQTYYNSGGWRATWSGEGGGVLINQCPHNLDLIQWFVGMPSRVTAHVGIGKYHNIEVEDEVTAYLDYPNGATGVFITSTGEAPGTNRLEIVGENGKLVYEHGKIQFTELNTPLSEYRANSPERFGGPSTTHYDIATSGSDTHRQITENFVDAVLNDAPLLAPAVEGINGLELGNAMLMSGLTGQPVDLPTDRDAFEALLKKLISESTFQKDEPVDTGIADLSSSF